MKTNKLILTAAAISAALLTFSANAGPLPGIRLIDTSRTISGSGAADRGSMFNPNSGSSARPNRRGADDPANHDLGDDRGMNQPGDDHGRHHGRGRHGH
jgi:hypothetical protein